MAEFYIYILCIFCIFFILFQGLKNKNVLPYKMKLISTVLYLLLIFKFIGIISLLLLSNIKYLYIFKYFYFIDFIAMPVGVLLCFYICIRNNKFNLNYMYFIIVLFSLMYLLLVMRYPINIDISNNVYVMNILTPFNIYFYFIIINLIFLFLAFLNTGKKQINRNILYLIFISSIVNIIEILVYLFKITKMPPGVVGNLIWIYTIYYSLSKLRKTN